MQLEKKALNLEEIEAQAALELPDRQVVEDVGDRSHHQRPQQPVGRR
jgi:hypothetical protein